MRKTCKNWLGLVNSCIYHASRTCEIYQALLYIVEYWVIQYLVSVVVLEIKDF